MVVSCGAAIQLGTNAIIFYSNRQSNSTSSVVSPSFLVLLVPFWFHSAMEIAYLHFYDGVPLGEL